MYLLGFIHVCIWLGWRLGIVCGEGWVEVHTHRDYNRCNSTWVLYLVWSEENGVVCNIFTHLSHLFISSYVHFMSFYFILLLIFLPGCIGGWSGTDVKYDYNTCNNIAVLGYLGHCYANYKLIYIILNWVYWTHSIQSIFWNVTVKYVCYRYKEGVHNPCIAQDFAG